eukprot:112139_1
MAGVLWRNFNESQGVLTRGKIIKIDINNGKILKEWYSIDMDQFTYNITDANNAHIYRGASIWNIPAIIDDYLVFGTGNLWTYPKYIEDCLLGNYDSFPIENANYFDPCKRDRSLDSKWWRCLEKNVYPDSFVVLNKHTFELESSTPLQGVDAWSRPCEQNVINNISDPYCMKVIGPDVDLAAVAAYKHPITSKLYTAVVQKSGHFYVFEIPSGNVMISKKICLWGGGQWSIAVDEINMIAIVTITGKTSNILSYKYELMDGTIICGDTGTTHAIDLNTGYTIWQIANPWGTFNDKCNDSIYDQYYDYTLNATCQFDSFGNEFNQTKELNHVHVIVPPHNESDRNRLENNYQRFVAPVTILDDMVFIPSYSGEIFVHNLFNGSFIYSIVCPGRYLIKGGVTIIDNRVIFQCGAQSIVVSMKLK